MNFKKILSLLFVSLLTFAVISCSDDPVGPADDNRTPAPPANAKAQSANETSIKVMWDKSTDEADSAFAGYILKITGDDNTTSIDTIPATFNPVQVNQLSQGVIYTVEIRALFKNGNRSTATTVLWSPAFRFTKNVNDEIIKLYESSSQLGSGLDVYDATEKKPKTLKVASGEYWTIGLDTRNNQVIVASPTLIDYNYPTTPGYTEISQTYFDATSLDDIYDSEALNVGSFSPYSVPLHAITNDITKNIVLIVRTKESGSNDFNYAKILIKKQAGNTWLAGTSPNRYVEVEVSYQQKANVPYAKKPLN